MELRDYLSPDEYVLALVRNVNIEDGEFRNIAVTNRRIILFKTKQRGLLKKTEEVSDMRSFFFEGAHRIVLHRREKGIPGKIKWIYVFVGDATFKIYPGIGRTSPDNVLTTLIRVFEDLGLQREDKYEDLEDGERNYDITFTFPE